MENDEPTPDAPPVDVDPIAVVGEASSGQVRPIWMWEVPDATRELRVRLVSVASGRETAGAVQFLAATQTRWSPTEDLEPGAYRFEIEARDGDERWFAKGTFDTTVEVFSSGVWKGVKRQRHVSTLGHEVAVSCLSCFATDATTPAENLAPTATKVRTAQANGADAIELAITAFNGIWYVDGRIGIQPTGALLEQVLADAELRRGDQLLVLEIADAAPSQDDLTSLMKLLRGNGYAVNGRPVVLRATAIADTATTQLQLPRSLMALRELETLDSDPFHAPYLRFEVALPDWRDMASLYDFILAVAQREWHGIVVTPGLTNVYAPIAYARSLGLGVGLRGAAIRPHCATYRESVDLIAADSALLPQCVTAIANTVNLLHFDAAAQNTAGSVLAYRVGTEERTAAVTETGEVPKLHFDGTGTSSQDRYGTSLYFFTSQSDHLALDTIDASTGIVVATVVNFDTLQIAAPSTGETVASVVSKRSGTTGFALELARAAGSATTLLRFRVFIGNQAYSATVDAALFNGDDSYFIVGSYESDSPVQLHVNGVKRTSSAAASGAVGVNTAPVTLGAEPGAVAATKWGGLIQFLTIAAWPAP